MNYPGVAKRIKESLGDVKIVMILRDPIRRAFSQYWDNRRHLSEFRNESEIISEFLSEDYSETSKGYFSRGVYAKYIQEYNNYFSHENIFIMFLEELISNPQTELANLYNFLGISVLEEYLSTGQASNSSHVWNNFAYQFLLNNPEYNKFIPKRLRRLFFIGSKEPFKYPLPEIELLSELKDFYEPWKNRLENTLNRKIDFWI
jgi:hypothetical protein